MKRKILFIAIALLTTTTISAQWLSLGIKSGYSAILQQNQSYKEIFNATNNLQNGGHIGLYMRLGRTWYVQPEVLYNYYNLKSSFNSKEIKNNAHSIDVPVLLGIHLINTKHIKLRLMTGPKFNFNVGKLEDITMEDITFKTRNTRLALDCGIGIDIWRISLDVRYNLSQNLLKIQDTNGELLNKQPNHSIQTSIGFRLIGNNKKK